MFTKISSFFLRTGAVAGSTGGGGGGGARRCEGASMYEGVVVSAAGARSAGQPMPPTIKSDDCARLLIISVKSLTSLFVLGHRCVRSLEKTGPPPTFASPTNNWKETSNAPVLG